MVVNKIYNLGMTKEHLGLALALNVPVFVVITKIDMCPPNVFQETLKILQKILKSPGCRKIGKCELFLKIKLSIISNT